MTYQIACRAARVLPNVIANLIAEYAEYTLEDRIDCLCGGDYKPGTDIVEETDGGKLLCWWTAHCEGRITLMFNTIPLVILPCVSKAGLAELICTRQCRTTHVLLMIDPEHAEILKEWMNSITESMWREYHARSTSAESAR